VPTIDLLTLEWQARFLADRSDIRAVIGGVGSGKSLICADELIERAMRYPHARHYIIGASHPAMKEGTIPTFLSRLDEHGYTYSLNRQDLSVTITSGPAKGCRIITWTVANDRWQKLKGQMIDSAWLDECQVWDRGQEAYDFIVNRLRPSEEAQRHHANLECRLWLSANPPHTTSHWLYRYFVKGAKAPLYQATVFDNVLMPQRDKYVDRLRSQYAPDLFKIEVMGEWGDIGVGVVYSSFARASNVAESFVGVPVEFDPRLPIEWCHDFGVVPRVSLLCQTHKVDAPGYQPEVLVVFDEITQSEGNTADQIAEFVNRYPSDVMSALVLYGDPAGQARNSTTGQSDWSMLAWDERITPYGPTIDRATAPPPIVDRVNGMNAKLCNAKAEVGIVIHPRCEKSIEDLQSTKYKDGTRVLDHGSPSRGVYRTHWSDALGYLVARKWPLRPYVVAAPFEPFYS